MTQVPSELVAVPARWGFNTSTPLDMALAEIVLKLVAYNLSRIASYAAAGALAGLLGRTLLRAVDVAPLSVAFRVAAGLIMIRISSPIMK